MLLQSEAWFSWYQLAFSGVGAIFGAECQKRGMLVRVAGDNIMMSPPLIMTPDEVEEVIHQIKTHSSHHPSSLFSDHNRRTELWSSNTEHPFLTKQYFYWTSKTDELNSQATVLNNEHLFVDKKKSNEHLKLTNCSIEHPFWQKKKVLNIWNCPLHCFSAGEHLWRCTQGHRGEGGWAEIQEEQLDRVDNSSSCNCTRRRWRW